MNSSMKATTLPRPEQQQTPDPEFMTVREFANEMRLNPRTAYEYVQDIPGVIKLGPRMTRIPRAGFRAFIKALGGSPT